jgi:hypothetical protein
VVQVVKRLLYKHETLSLNHSPIKKKKKKERKKRKKKREREIGNK